MLCACAEDSGSVNQTELVLQVDGQEVACGSDVMLFGKSWQLAQFGMFISKVKLDGKPVKLQTNHWQSQQIALFMQSGDCSQASNHILQFAGDVNDFLTLSFEMAVPFALNHQNPLRQASPLNLSSMFWTWQTGHKFLRVDLHNKSDNFSFHLGSIGCESASKVRSPSAECAKPNRFSFTLQKQDSGNRLVLHLDKLFADLAATQDQRMQQQTCMFHTANELGCAQLMLNLEQQGIFEWR